MYPGFELHVLLFHKGLDCSLDMHVPRVRAGGVPELHQHSDHLWMCRYSRSELEAIDSEGRCVVTEHGGQLVVFNVYLPATTRSGVQGAVGDRYEYKLRMLQAR